MFFWKLFRSLCYATWFRRQTRAKWSSHSFYLLQSSFVSLARQTKQPLVMECANETGWGMVSSEFCRADAHKRRGHPGKTGCHSVGESIFSPLQPRWNEFYTLQGKPWCQGRWLNPVHSDISMYNLYTIFFTFLIER